MEHVAVVSHDAGGAEILSSWHNRAHCRASVVVAGPASAIFKRKCPQAEHLTLEAALDICNWVLCGTGWQSSLERQAIKLGHALGKKTVAFLDHWVNYQERFEEAGHYILPDEIWVGDIDAERIARRLFEGTPVILHSNPYFEDLLVGIDRVKMRITKTSETTVLYVCEPIADHAREQHGNDEHWGYNEHSALRYFLANLQNLVPKIDAVTLRPHPSEHADKYYWANDVAPVPIEFGGQKTLLEEVLAADIVAGCESMAMVAGILAGKRVVSTIPPGGRPCQLPHREIEHMSLLA